MDQTMFTTSTFVYRRVATKNVATGELEERKFFETTVKAQILKATLRVARWRFRVGGPLKRGVTVYG